MSDKIIYKVSEKPHETYDDGVQAAFIIGNSIEKNHNVTIHFNNVIACNSHFIYGLIDELYKRFPKEILKNHVSFVTKAMDKKRISCYIKTIGS